MCSFYKFPQLIKTSIYELTVKGASFRHPLFFVLVLNWRNSWFQWRLGWFEITIFMQSSNWWCLQENYVRDKRFILLRPCKVLLSSIVWIRRRKRRGWGWFFLCHGWIFSSHIFEWQISALEKYYWMMNHNRQHLNSARAAFVPGIRFIGIKAAEKGKSRCNERVGRGFAFGLTLIRVPSTPSVSAAAVDAVENMLVGCPSGKPMHVWLSASKNTQLSILNAHKW